MSFVAQVLKTKILLVVCADKSKTHRRVLESMFDFVLLIVIKRYIQSNLLIKQRRRALGKGAQRRETCCSWALKIKNFQVHFVTILILCNKYINIILIKCH